MATTERLIHNSDGHEPRSGATFSRSWTDTLAFPRAFTESAFNLIDFESEEALLRKIIEDYKKVAEKGPEGDIPIPEGFGRNPTFWKIIATGVIFGGIMGIVGIGVLNCATEIPKLWIDNGNFDEISDFDYYGGSLTWVIVTTCTGFFVGLIRWLSGYPDNVAGFFKEVNSCHVEPKYVPFTVTLSALSLAGGACLGPEACLGNFGGGMGTFISQRLSLVEESDKKLVVLGGMSAALGALFPSPFLAVLMITELCVNLPKSYMETAVVTAVPAIVSFIVFFSMCDLAYLVPLKAEYSLSDNWEFKLNHCIYGFIIGIVSGCLCLTQLLAVGICKQLFIRLRDRCDSTSFLSGTIIAPTIGGLIIGLINWVLPMTVGDGNLVSGPIIKFALFGERTSTGATYLDETMLLKCMFAKMFCLAISMNCGMIGGFIFPMLTIGIMCSAIAHLRYAEMPILLFISCFVAGIPSGICPMPFTLVCLPMVLYFIGLEQTAPVFISAFTSYMVICGSGLFAAIASRGVVGKKESSLSLDMEEPIKYEGVTRNKINASYRPPI